MIFLAKSIVLCCLFGGSNYVPNSVYFYDTSAYRVIAVTEE